MYKTYLYVLRDQFFMVTIYNKIRYIIYYNITYSNRHLCILVGKIHYAAKFENILHVLTSKLSMHITLRTFAAIINLFAHMCWALPGLSQIHTNVERIFITIPVSYHLIFSLNFWDVKTHLKCFTWACNNLRRNENYEEMRCH